MVLALNPCILPESWGLQPPEGKPPQHLLGYRERQMVPCSILYARRDERRVEEQWRTPLQLAGLIASR